MGFYAPSQIVQDARRHGVKVRPVDVRHSDWDCTLEAERHTTGDPAPGSARRCAALREDAAERIEQARAQQAFADVADLCERAATRCARRRAAGRCRRAARDWPATVIVRAGQVAGVEQTTAAVCGHTQPAEIADRACPRPRVAEDVLSRLRHDRPDASGRIR